MGKSRKIKKIIKIITISTLSVIIIVLSIGFLGFYLATKNTKLESEKLLLKSSSLSVLDTAGRDINENSKPISSSSIPAHTINAFIAKEDKRFYNHNGIDLIRIAGAFKNNIKSGTFSEGGSTITQQLIKNTHLSQEKTIKRKLNEIKLSLELEKYYSKDEILNTYLNSIYFGNNIYGIGAASSFYFNKEVADLSLAESAILAGLISAPSLYNPIADLATSKTKASTVLMLMKNENYISDTEYSQALSELENIIVSKNKPTGALYSSFATHEALQILGLKSFPLNSKITIKTYLDNNLQKDMEEELKSVEYKAIFEDSPMSGIGSIVLDNTTGGIVAFAGNSPYNLESLKRQPASTIKPLLVYGPALEKGFISPASFILDEPINIDGYAPHNATKKYDGWKTVRDNIVRSTNVPAVKILNEVGIHDAIEFASSLGIEFTKDDYNLAIALGGMTEGVTIKDLATAYMCLANGGNYTNSTFIKEIYINDSCCYSHKPDFSRVMKESTSFLLTDMLKSVAEYGTARNLNSFKFDIASKTGTNAINGINHDGYNASYTTKHTAVCWIGNLGDVETENKPYYNGSLHPTHFIKSIFSSLYKDIKPEDFLMPESVKKVRLDKDSFLDHALYLADMSSTSYIEEYFELNSIPPVKPREEKEYSVISRVDDNNKSNSFDFMKFIKRHHSW